MFRGATIVVLILMAIGIWFMLSAFFPAIGGFFVKRGEKFMSRATEVESVEEKVVETAELVETERTEEKAEEVENDTK